MVTTGGGDEATTVRGRLEGEGLSQDAVGTAAALDGVGGASALSARVAVGKSVGDETSSIVDADLFASLVSVPAAVCLSSVRWARGRFRCGFNAASAISCA